MHQAIRLCMLIRPHCDAFSTCLSFVSIVLMILRSYRFKRKRYIISATGVYTHTHIYIHVYIHTRTRCQSRRCKFISETPKLLYAQLLNEERGRRGKSRSKNYFLNAFASLSNIHHVSWRKWKKKNENASFLHILFWHLLNETR